MQYTSNDYFTGAYNILRVERLLIIAALKKHKGVKTKAANSLKITVPTLTNKIYKHSIKDEEIAITN